MSKIISILMFLSISTFSSSQVSYMKISDPAFKGESVREAFKDYLEVLALAYAGSKATKDAGGTKLVFQDFSFTRNAGVNTPTFYLYLTTGKVIPEVKIETVQTTMSGEEEVAFRLTLYNVIVTSVQTSSSPGCPTCGVGHETVTLKYGKIKWESLTGNTQSEWTVIK